MKKIISFMLIFIIGISVVGCGAKKEKVSLEDLKVMPKFDLKDVNDKKVNNEIFKGNKLTMINIWATG
ncbi:hypothetical protein SAMN02745883_00911 [Caminicella sporogenes DSM 14501]|uniref:AhpC/TSA family protein n=1 Tax=Caminicella sporogenes DSM 14501 TaxID=1121266 RepID=A0A1M6NJP5_9FIRM|nr:hypothetical protein [Caminicella sporogenes]RKD22178.1 hypothetical protein BET04_06035 [Caminicella sporogenes]SHJ95917.1 hypothetical protein SAMN02745883_00911 [Caminicella sporogenes DSM 14501]